ncbi:surface lipoprotein assembly modifier [Neptuniibacter sp. PT34_22]|uniref:surface lipoprotein assembly modifier n=1 Tax=Neptuniibacter sp. PT34_22 TaxID=3398205 RepID=UPI0039F49837
MSKLYKYLAVILYCLSSFVAADTVTDLKNLVDQGKYAQAYQLALSHLESMEGDPAFDMQYGVAAIDSKHVSEGVFALERVIFLEPRNFLAKLELARGYYHLNQFEKAKQLFLQVKKVKPPQVVANRIDLYLSLIDKKTTIPPTKFTSFVELWAGYDSNLNSGPSDQTNVVILSSDALGRSGQYNQVRLGGDIEHAYSPDAALLFGAHADMRLYHTEDEQDYKNISVNGGHLWKMDDQQFQVNFVLQKYLLDRKQFRDLLGANAQWSKQLSRNSVAKLFVGANSLTYKDSAWKDALQLNAGANYLYAGEGSWNPLYFVSGFIGNESPEESNLFTNSLVDRVFFGGNLGVQLSPADNIKLTPSFTYQESEYAGEDWIYGIKRNDKYMLANLNIDWTVGPSWTLLGNYSYTKSDSNIELYEYDRQQVMLGLRYSFR